MNIITHASVKERIHVEQIIRSQPHMHNSGLVDIVTIPVRKCLGLSMDVYKPVGEVKEPLPIILDVHGGGLIAGRKEQNRNLGIQLARRGYIVFIPDYRLVPETDIFGQISDILDALSEFCERLQDEKDIREYLNTAVAIPDSAEVSAPIAAKYLRDAALFEQLVDETRRNQEENQSDFLTAVSDAVSFIEKSRDVKEWHGLTKDIAERFAREFMAERNPGRWSGFGEVPESVSLDPINFPINDIYPKGNKPALRMQLISVTYPSLHRVCECSIIEDGVDLWARRTLDSMTAGTVEDLVETVLYVARMYERSKCFERIYVNRIQMEKSEYDAILRHLNDPDSIDDEYRISDVVFAADNTTVSVLWKGNSKDGVSGMVTLAMNGKTVYKTKNTKTFCNHWILPYNGAEYHVLVDVLPKKTVLEETIYVNKPYAERIKKYLRGAEVQGDGSSLSKTAKFSDGFEMDIRCCGGKDDSWTEAILYDNTGKEVVATEPCDGFTGCWELKDEDTNTVYRAHVMTKSNLN